MAPRTVEELDKTPNVSEVMHNDARMVVERVMETAEMTVCKFAFWGGGAKVRGSR